MERHPTTRNSLVSGRVKSSKVSPEVWLSTLAQTSNPSLLGKNVTFSKYKLMMVMMNKFISVKFENFYGIPLSSINPVLLSYILFFLSVTALTSSFRVLVMILNPFINRKTVNFFSFGGAVETVSDGKAGEIDLSLR